MILRPFLGTTSDGFGATTRSIVYGLLKAS